MTKLNIMSAIATVAILILVGSCFYFFTAYQIVEFIAESICFICISVLIGGAIYLIFNWCKNIISGNHKDKPYSNIISDTTIPDKR